MKKIIYSVLVLLLFAMTACTENKDIYGEGPVMAPALSVSSVKVIFGPDGGRKEIIVLSNTEDWTYETTGSWATVTREGDVLIIRAEANAVSEILTATLTVVAQQEGNAVEEDILLAQAPYNAQNLSADGTANCYIVSTGNTYRFDATVKGNGNESGDGTSGYIETCGLQIDTLKAAYADLLWESTFEFNRSSCANVIQDIPYYDNGNIYFSTGTYQGNAVIALKDGAGNILWSWHIWVCNEPIEASAANGYEFMDRNLGALNNTPGDVNNRGLLYQWGRKDPFLPSGSSYASKQNEANRQVGDGSGKWIVEGQAPLPVSTAPGNIPHSIQHPMTFFGSYTSGVYSWYMAIKNSWACNNDLWGKDENAEGRRKSIFDPCPVGYRVPPAQAFGDLNQTETEYAANWGKAESFGRYWTGGNGDFFPFSGMIFIFDGINDTGTRAYYWTTTMVPDDVYSRNLYLASGRAAIFRAGHAYGCNVRCVKE